MNQNNPIDARKNSLGRRQLLGGIAGGAVAFAASPLLAACASSSKSSGGSSESDGLTLGISVPTSGVVASSYAPIFANAYFGISTINKSGGVLGKQIKTLKVNDDGTPEGAVSAVRQLYSDGIGYIIGPLGNSATAAAIPVSNRYKMIQCGASSDDSTGDSTKYPYTFRNGVTNTQEGLALANFVVKSLKMTKIGYLAENSTLGSGLLAVIGPQIKSLGASIVKTQSYDTTVTDFLPYVQNLKNAGAQVIIAAVGNIPNTTGMFQALDSLNWHPPIVGHPALLFPPVLQAKTVTPYLDDVYSISFTNFTWTGSGDVPDISLKFLQDFTAFDSQVSSLGQIGCTIGWYDFLTILKAAIERAKTTEVAAVLNALNQTSNQVTLTGTWSYSKASHIGIHDGSVAIAKLSSISDPRSKNGIFFENVPIL
jgi:branched-chain amino acid transport system substrate-binding protein